MTQEEADRHSEITSLLTETLAESKGTRAEVGAAREEVAALSTAFQLHEQANVHEFASVGETLKSQNSRVGKLEGRAEASGAHDINALQAQLNERKADAALWRGRIWAIASVLIVSGLVGLVTHYFATR